MDPSPPSADEPMLSTNQPSETEKEIINETEKEIINETEKETTKEAEKETETQKETIQETQQDTIQEIEEETPRVSPERKYDFDRVLANVDLPGSSDSLRHQIDLNLPFQSSEENYDEVKAALNIHMQWSNKDPSEFRPWTWEMDPINEDLILNIMSLQSQFSVPADPANPDIIDHIRSLILGGEIDLATNFLKWHYPKLILESKQITCVLYVLAYQNAIEHVRQRQMERARHFTETTAKLLSDNYPWLREDLMKFSSLLDCEDPWQNPHKELLHLPRRQQTAGVVINQIASVYCGDKNETQIIEDIRSSILSGDISLAMSHISSHYYELIHVQGYTPKMLFDLAYQHAIELLRCGQVEQARRFAETSLNWVADRHPERRDEVERVLSLINCEDHLESHRELLDLSRRQLTVNQVLDQIPIIGDNQIPNLDENEIPNVGNENEVPNVGNDDDQKDGSSCSSN